MNKEKISKVYNYLAGEGYTDLGTLEEFTEKMNDGKKRKIVYDALVASGITDAKEFSKKIGYNPTPYDALQKMQQMNEESRPEVSTKEKPLTIQEEPTIADMWGISPLPSYEQMQERASQMNANAWVTDPEAKRPSDTISRKSVVDMFAPRPLTDVVQAERDAVLKPSEQTLQNIADGDIGEDELKYLDGQQKMALHRLDAIIAKAEALEGGEYIVGGGLKSTPVLTPKGQLLSRLKEVRDKYESIVTVGEVMNSEEGKRYQELLAEYEQSPEEFYWTAANGSAIATPKGRELRSLKRKLDNKGMLKGLENIDVLDIVSAGYTSLIEGLGDASILQKYSDGEKLTPTEQLYMDMYNEKSRLDSIVGAKGGATRGYRTGEMMTETLPFVTGMAATGGVGNLAKAGASAGLKKFGLDATKKTLYRYVDDFVGAAVGAAAQTPLQAGWGANYGERAVQEYIENGRLVDSKFDRARKSFSDAYIDTFTERWGGVLTRSLKSAMPSFGIKSFLSQRFGTHAGFVDDILSRVQFNGPIEEFEEEMWANFLSPLLRGASREERKAEWDEAFSSDNLWITAMTTAMMSGSFGSMRAIQSGAQAVEYSKINKKAKDALENINDKTLRQSIVDAINMPSMRETAEAMANINWGNKDAPDVANAMDYYRYAIEKQIYNGTMDAAEANKLFGGTVASVNSKSFNGLGKLVATAKYADSMVYVLQEKDGSAIVLHEDGHQEQVPSSSLTELSVASVDELLTNLYGEKIKEVSETNSQERAAEEKAELRELGVVTDRTAEESPISTGDEVQVGDKVGVVETINEADGTARVRIDGEEGLQRVNISELQRVTEQPVAEEIAAPSEEGAPTKIEPILNDNGEVDVVAMGEENAAQYVAESGDTSYVDDVIADRRKKLEKVQKGGALPLNLEERKKAIAERNAERARLEEEILMWEGVKNRLSQPKQTEQVAEQTTEEVIEQPTPEVTPVDETPEMEEAEQAEVVENATRVEGEQVEVVAEQPSEQGVAEQGSDIRTMEQVKASTFEAGVVRNEAAEDVANIDVIDKIGKALGVRIVIVDDVQEGGIEANGLYDRSSSTPTIYISKTRDKGGNFVIGHEMLHRMAQVSPDAYNRFKQFVIDELGEEEVNSRFGRIKSAYENAIERALNRGEQTITMPTDEVLMEEIVADFVGDVTSEDARAFNRLADSLARNDKPLLRAFRNVVEHIHSFFKKGTPQERRIARRLKALDNLLAESVKAVEGSKPKAKRVRQSNFAENTRNAYRKEINAIFGGEYPSIEAEILADIATGRVKFIRKNDGNKRGLESFFGNRPKELNSRIGITAKAENGGYSLDGYVHEFAQSPHHFWGNKSASEVDFDDSLIRDALESVLLTTSSPTSAMKQLREMHKTQNENHYEDEGYIESLLEDEQAEIWESYQYLSEEEYAALNELFAESYFDEVENNNNFAQNRQQDDKGRIVGENNAQREGQGIAKTSGVEVGYGPIRGGFSGEAESEGGQADNGASTLRGARADRGDGERPELSVRLQQRRRVEQQAAQDIDSRIEQQQNKVRQLLNTYTQKKKEIGEAYSQDNQGTLFEETTAPTDSLFEVERDFSQNNLNNILRPIQEELNAEIAELEALKYSREQFIADAVAAYEAQLEIGDGNTPSLYSLRESAKSLVGIHNISLEKLQKAIKVGGLANPSVAVLDVDKTTHDDYGDISLILSSNMVDSRLGRNAGTWAGDAWTPTYPQVVKRIDKDENISRFYKDINKMPDRMRNKVALDWNSYLEDRTAPALAYWFLFEKGNAPEILTIPVKYPENIVERVRNATNGAFSLYQLSPEERITVVEAFIAQEYNGDRAAYEKALQDKIERIESRGLSHKSALVRKSAELNLASIKEFGFDYDQISDFVREIERDFNHRGEEDIEGTIRNAQEYIKENGLQDEFDAWKVELDNRYNVGEYIFNGYTNSGDKKWLPHTIENASKWMKKQGREGSVATFPSFGVFVAVAIPRMTSLASIRKRKSQLGKTEQEFNEFKDRWEQVYYELGQKLQPDANSYEDYGWWRLIEAVGQKHPREFIRRQYGIELSDSDVQQFNKLINAIRTNYPARYFETKFERPVQLSEFTAAVVPESTPEEVKTTLREEGLNVYEYDENVEGSRREATLDATDSDGVRFSLREDTDSLLSIKAMDAPYLEAVERGDMETAQRMVMEAAKIAMPNTKVVDEDGNPKVVYHQTNASVYINRETGQNWYELDWRERMEWDERDDWDDYWEEREFNTFSRVNARTTNEFDGFFFAPEYDEYHEYGDRTIAAFVNIENPASKGDYNIDSSKNNAGREERIRLQNEGYDGVIREFDGVVDEYIAFEPNQIKSADPVTYDDNGNVIPLSERFNPRKADIRFSLRENNRLTKYKTEKIFGGIWIEDRQEFTKFASAVKTFPFEEDGEGIVFTDNYFYAYYRNIDGQAIPFISVYMNRDESQDVVNQVNQELKDVRTGERIKEYIDTAISRAWRKQSQNNDNNGNNSGTSNRRRNGVLGVNLLRKGRYFDRPDLYVKTSRADINEYDDIDAREEEADYRYSLRETNPEVLEQLNNGETIKAYRAMQIIDGKLYPPMSAKVEGKLREPIELGVWERAEERPNLVDSKGYFKLDKGNKSSVPARYNPYIHTSLTPLNDQFSSAQDRPNLVTVEVEVPVSELTSGYKAEKAKDSVGKLEWKAGVVQSKLSGTRTVILSRWDKPIRIVPDSEVAQRIVEMFDGKQITMPSNVVTPSLRAELEKLGVSFRETDNKGKPRFSLRQPTAEENPDSRFALRNMVPTNKPVTYDNFFNSTAGIWETLPISEVPTREPDYASQRWDGFGVSSRYWYGEDDGGQYVIRESDHWSGVLTNDSFIDDFERHPYSRHYTPIASCRWALDGQSLKGDNYREKVENLKSTFGDDSGSIYGKIYLRSLTHYKDADVRRSLRDVEPLNEQPLYSIKAPEDILEQRLKHNEGRIEKGFIAFRRKFEDYLIEIKRLQEALQMNGVEINGDNDFYAKENAASSVAEYAMGVYERNIIAPLTEWIRYLQTEYGLSIEDITDYLLAKHSLERHDSGLNAINPDDDALWGRNAVKAIIDDFEKRVNADDVDKLWNLIGIVNDANLEILRKGGIKSKEDIAEIKSHDWQYYVPLMEWDDKSEGRSDPMEQFDVEVKSRNGSTKGKWYQPNAEGRKSKPSEPIGHMIHMGYRAIIAAEANKAKQALYVLVNDARATLGEKVKDELQVIREYYVKENGEWKLVSATDIPKEALDKFRRDRKAISQKVKERQELYKQANKLQLKGKIEEAEALREQARELNDEIAEIRESMEVRMKNHQPDTSYERPNAQRIERDRRVLLYINGEPIELRFENVRYANAINRANEVGIKNAHFLDIVKRATRTLSSLSTSWNPAFALVTNPIRDFILASSMHMLDAQNGHFKDFLRNYWANIPTAIRNTANNGNPLTQEEMNGKNILNASDRSVLIADYGEDRVKDTLFKIYAENGGMTGFAYLEDLDAIRRKIRRTANNAKNGATIVKDAFGAYEDFTKAAEVITRYATFLAAIDNGESVTDAISAARNITVNFGRRGDATSVMSSLYVFFNAFVQGTAQIGRVAMKNKKRAVAMMAALATFGYLWSNLLDGAWDDDEDEDKLSTNKVSDWLRQGYFAIPISQGRGAVIRLPLPQGLRVPFAIGALISDFKNDMINVDELLVGVLNSIATDFTYGYNEGGGAGRALIPTVGQPIYDLLRNKDVWGRSIYREDKYDKGTPDTQLGKQNVSPFIKSITDFLNNITGGDKYSSGLIDINPSKVQYLLEQYAGGLGGLIRRTSELTTSLFDKRVEFELQNIPMLGNLLYTVQPENLYGKYDKIRRGYGQEAKGTIKARLRDGDITRESPDFVEFAKKNLLVKSFDKVIDGLTKLRNTYPVGSEEYDIINREIRRQRNLLVKVYEGVEWSRDDIADQVAKMVEYYDAERRDNITNLFNKYGKQ